MNLVIDQLPDRRSLYWAALKSLRRKPSGEVVLPELSASHSGFTFDAALLAQYCRLCGFDPAAGIPITYPQVCAIAIQMHLLTRPQFPLPLLGLVHLRNDITQSTPLDPAGVYTVRVGLGQSLLTERGLEFTIEASFEDADGAVPWKAIATVLYRGVRAPGERRKTPPPVDQGPAAEYLTFDAPADIGRRYAAVSGDHNPIHLYPLSARLFGFPRHLAHGMWSLARCCALLQDGLGQAPTALTVRFLQPLFLPSRVSVRYRSEASARTFSLLGQKDGKTHLLGTLR